MYYNLLNIAPIKNNLFIDNKINNIKIVQEILEDNYLFINKLFKNPSDNLWDILSINIFNSISFKNEIKKKFEESLDYIERNTIINTFENCLFNDINTEIKLEAISKIYEIKVVLYNINFYKYSLQSKIYGNIKNNKSIKILIYKNQFYSILDQQEEDERNKNYYLIRNSKEKILFEASLSTNDSKEILSTDIENKINLSEIDCFVLFLNGKLKNNINLPFNINLLKNNKYLKTIEKMFPRDNSKIQDISQDESEIKDINLKRNYGNLKFFDKIKGFGFFVNNEDKSDLFVHYDDLNKIDLNFDLFGLFNKEFYIGFTYKIFEYFGKHNKSRKAINIRLEEVKILKNKITN